MYPGIELGILSRGYGINIVYFVGFFGQSSRYEIGCLIICDGSLGFGGIGPDYDGAVYQDLCPELFPSVLCEPLNSEISVDYLYVFISVVEGIPVYEAIIPVSYGVAADTVSGV